MQVIITHNPNGIGRIEISGPIAYSAKFKSVCIDNDFGVRDVQNDLDGVERKPTGETTHTINMDIID